MKNFVFCPDGTYSRFSNKTQDFLNKLRMMNIQFLMSYYSLPHSIAEASHDQMFQDLSKKEGRAFLAMDLSIHKITHEPMMTILLCDDPMVTLKEETITFLTHSLKIEATIKRKS